MPTCICGGIRPGWVEPASPIELTTSRAEAFQARRSCAWPKARGPERDSLIVIAHAFSWPPVRLRHVRSGVGRSISLISSPSGRLAAWPNHRSLLCTSRGGILERWWQRRSSTNGTQFLRLTCRTRWMLSLSKTSSIRLLVSGNRRAKSSAPLPCRPCPL